MPRKLWIIKAAYRFQIYERNHFLKNWLVAFQKIMKLLLVVICKIFFLEKSFMNQKIFLNFFCAYVNESLLCQNPVFDILKTLLKLPNLFRNVF